MKRGRYSKKLCFVVLEGNLAPERDERLAARLRRLIDRSLKIQVCCNHNDERNRRGTLGVLTVSIHEKIARAHCGDKWSEVPLVAVESAAKVRNVHPSNPLELPTYIHYEV